MIKCLAGKGHAAALADELAEQIRPTRRWFTTVMTGHFRLSGSFVSDDIQIRPIDDLRSAAFTSLPGVPQNPSRHQPPLSAALIDFAYTGGDDSFVAMRRMDVAMRDVCNLVTLSTLRSMSQPVGGEQWNLVWDESLSEMRNARLYAGFDHAEVGEPCQQCSAPRHGIEKRVNQFLDEFAGREIRTEFRKVVYEQRSRIVHGALLHDIDHPFMSVGGRSDMDVLCVQGSVHAALLNWLRQPPSDTSGRRTQV